MASTDSLNHFALVFITRKNKKIEVVLPLIAELQILDLDSLNFYCYWDPKGFEQPMMSGGLSPPTTATYKIRILCNHAGEKKTLLERIQSVK